MRKRIANCMPVAVMTSLKIEMLDEKRKLVGEQLKLNEMTRAKTYKKQLNDTRNQSTTHNLQE